MLVIPSGCPSVRPSTSAEKASKEAPKEEGRTSVIVIGAPESKFGTGCVRIEITLEHKKPFGDVTVFKLRFSWTY